MTVSTASSKQAELKELRYDLNAINGTLKVQATTGKPFKGKAAFSARLIDNVKEVSSEVRIKLEAISLWVNRENGDLVRGYFVFPRSGKLSTAFRELFKRDKVIRYSHVAAFTCDESCEVIRYGNDLGFYTVGDKVDYGNMIFYPSKADAIRGVISSSRSGATIGGIDTVNLNSIPNEIFLELGMTEVPDELGRSQSMWSANPDVITGARSGSSTYRSMEENMKSIISIIKRGVESDGK